MAAIKKSSRLMKTSIHSPFRISRSASRTLVLAAAMAFAASASADDFSLYYDQSDGKTATLVAAVTQIDKIVFEGGSIKVVQTDGKSTALTTSAVKRLYFSTPSTVSSISDASISDPVDPEADVLDMTGRVVGKAKNLSVLPQGAYIISGKKVSK